MTEKTLRNTDLSKAKDNVSDLQVFGDGDMFKLLCKASSRSEGWMKSTKALDINGAGCLVQVTTQQKNSDGSYSVAEALTYVPDVYVKQQYEVPGDPTSNIVGRTLEYNCEDITDQCDA